MKKLKTVALLGFIILGLYSFTTVQSDWVVPAEYQKMTNPTDPDDDESIEIGEELYMKHCKSCHGKEGLGDGPKAAEQKGDLGDFSSAEFQGQSDGTLFYKSKIGKDDMPDFSKKITNDEDIWFIVDFMRTLGE